MEEASHFIFVGGPQAPVGFHMRPCYDVSRFSGELEWQYPDIRTFLFVPDDQEPKDISPDDYVESTTSMLRLLSSTLPAFSCSVRKRLCYVLQGPAETIQQIAADVEQEFRKMADNWKNCEYLYDNDVI